MMQYTLRRKIVATFFIFASVLVIVTSVIYYRLMLRNIQERSRTQISSAFAMMFDGFASQASQTLPQIEAFLHESLVSPLRFLARMHAKTPPLKQEWDENDTQTWIYAQNYLKRLENIAGYLPKLLDILDVYRCVLYDQDRDAIVVYQQPETGESGGVGVYLAYFRGGTFLPLNTPENRAAMTSWQGLQHIERASLPDDISAFYPHNIPVAPLAELSQTGQRATIKFTVPIVREDDFLGMFVLHLAIAQDAIERYARFSQTQINVFAQSTLSVGTLPDAQTLTFSDADTFEHLDLLNFAGPPQADFSRERIGGHSYYQGKVLFQDRQSNRGGITVDFDRQIEARRRNELLLLISGVTLGLVGVTIFISIALSKRITQPLSQLTAYADSIGSGQLDLHIPVDQQDEIGQLARTFNAMTANLNTFIGQVQQSGIQVTSSTVQLSASARQQEGIVEHQMTSMSNVVQAVQEIDEVLSQVVETMQRVSSMSEETAEFATSGQGNLTRMRDAMHRMQTASHSISHRLELINEKAQNITSVVTTINKVADQTNLLSLNAAIEAEKAGEYGRGFTVVAREIRRLADQTAMATFDIDQMIQEMEAAVTAGVMEMDKFIAEVRQSVEDVEVISQQLGRIIDQVQTLAPNFEDVNVAMRQQSENAQTINSAITGLSQEMAQTRNSLQETYSAITQLNDAARNLQDQVLRFRVSEQSDEPSHAK